MTELNYRETIKEANNFVILTDDSEVLKIFTTESEADIYCSTKMRHTVNNKIDLYKTTGIPTQIIDGIIHRNDIKPLKNLHMGMNW